MQFEELQEIQLALTNYLLGQESKIDQHICQAGPLTVAQRLSIYRTGYKARLKEVLEIDHEVLARYLGDQWWETLVYRYISCVPSQYTSLRQYGNGLPVFLATDQQFAQIPLLEELARFERCLLDAFDAAGSAPCAGDVLASVSPQDWPRLMLHPHPSARVIEFQWNVVPIWQALKADEIPPEPLQSTNHWLVWRNSQLLTEFRSLETFELSLLRHLLVGTSSEALSFEALSFETFSFESLCDQAIEALSTDEVGDSTVQIDEVAKAVMGLFLRWLDSGLIAKIVL